VEPNWAPLENRLGTTRCVGFMYMGRVNGINQYKHGITRTYLYLDDEGKCYLKAEKRRLRTWKLGCRTRQDGGLPGQVGCQPGHTLR
jgi:hypothetical protein